jgi:hypothetical protein
MHVQFENKVNAPIHVDVAVLVPKDRYDGIGTSKLVELLTKFETAGVRCH